jgi:hypothetical protein
MGKILEQHETMRVRLEAAEKFIRQPEIHQLHVDYLQEERQKAEALERQREEERRLEHEAYRARRSMGMGR